MLATIGSVMRTLLYAIVAGVISKALYDFGRKKVQEYRSRATEEGRRRAEAEKRKLYDYVDRLVSLPTERECFYFSALRRLHVYYGVLLAGLLNAAIVLLLLANMSNAGILNTPFTWAGIQNLLENNFAQVMEGVTAYLLLLCEPIMLFQFNKVKKKSDFDDEVFHVMRKYLTQAPSSQRQKGIDPIGILPK